MLHFNIYLETTKTNRGSVLAAGSQGLSSSTSLKYFKPLDRPLKVGAFFKPCLRPNYQIYSKSNSTSVVLLTNAFFKDCQDKVCNKPTNLFSFSFANLNKFLLSRLNTTDQLVKDLNSNANIQRVNFLHCKNFSKKLFARDIMNASFNTIIVQTFPFFA